jgi:DNA polymerase-3 subunit gamma/tau
MSYLVLARKYRSRDFEALVGQEHVVKALTNALTQQRLHHAYLFTGTRGVGKTSVSRILAKALNCTGPDGTGGITAQPCGVCDACRDIDSGRFVDYVELDAASNRGVEEISQLLDQAVYKPVVGRFKVYLIDEVHMLSNTAFNAMLKTLEEPPEYLKFVLATTDPQKVPPTVLSRCLQFNLRPMAPQTVQEHLSTVLAAEKIDAEPGALRLLARAARGSMRDALSLTDQAIAFGAGSLSEAGVRQMLGAVDRSHAVRLVEALAAGQGAEVIAAVDGLRSLGLSATGTLEEMVALLQQMAVLQAVPDALDESDPDAPTAARLAGLLAPDETQFLYSIVLHGRAELGLAPDEYSGLVMVLLRMLAFRPGGVAAAPQRSMPTTSAKPAAAAPVLSRPAAAPAAPAVPARPAVVASAPVARASAPASEPPPWLDDEPPYEGEGFAAEVSVREPEPQKMQRPPAPVPATAATWVATPLGDRWAEVVGQMNEAASISALVRELAMQAQCVAIDEKAQPAVWRLRVERETLRTPAQRDKLQAALSELLKQSVQLELEAGVASDTPAQRAGAERARRQNEAEQIIHNDPLVQALMQQFKTARIVPGSVKFH